MRKLFYEIKSNFEPTHFLIMGRNREEDFQPLTFNGVEGSFFYSYPSENSLYSDEAAEIYDKDTAIKLLGHHTINRSNGFKDIKLFPVYLESQPKLHMIFGTNENDEDDIPTPLSCLENGLLSWSKFFEDSNLPAPELFDLHTAREIVKRQIEFQNGLSPENPSVRFSMTIIPVNISPSLSSYNNVYLNPTGSLDDLIIDIKETCKYCRSTDPIGPHNAWNLPYSLGANEIVPATKEE